MPKMKTNSSAKKRFRRTGTGKIMRQHAYMGHILTKKSTKRKRRLVKDAEVHKADRKRVERMLG